VGLGAFTGVVERGAKVMGGGHRLLRTDVRALSRCDARLIWRLSWARRVGDCNYVCFRWFVGDVRLGRGGPWFEWVETRLRGGCRAGGWVENGGVWCFFVRRRRCVVGFVICVPTLIKAIV